MYEGDLPPRSYGIRRLTRLCLLTLLVAALLADLPLALVGSFRTHLRYLAQIRTGRESALIADIYDAGAMPRFAALSLDPAAILQKRVLAASRHSTAAVPPSNAPTVAEPGWRIARAAPPTDRGLHLRPAPRAYDPLGPPFAAA